VVVGFWLEVVVGTVDLMLELVLELLELLVLEAEEEEAELAADDDEKVGVVDEVGVVVGIGNTGVVSDDVLNVDGVLKLKI